MAAPFECLQSDATCSICLDYFKDPVLTECGHNFCRPCITCCWVEAGHQPLCPECRHICVRGHLRANRQLGSMAASVRELSARAQEQNLCVKHSEQLKLYCREEEQALCLVCSLSADHRAHDMIPIEEAAVLCKKKLESERLKIVAEFERLHQLLEDKEQTVATRLGEMDKIFAIASQIHSLRVLIAEIEGTCQQPEGELLKNFRNTLSRCEDVAFQTPLVMRKNYKVRVTLDPDTAHPGLILSEDGRRVAETRPEQPRTDNPKRFTNHTSVLGREGFSSGRHYWELQLLTDGGLTVGVVEESVNRKQWVRFSPDVGAWTVQQRGLNGPYEALTSLCPTPLSPTLPLMKLALDLDYEGGRLSIYNADTMEEIYTFTGAAFSGTIYPYFGLWTWTDLRLL